jgi:alpha-tubulin suppressor-like RCC1 family protein
MWSWGRNDSGKLGLGDTANRSSPVQIGAGITWSSVSCGGQSSFSVAVKTDGTMWSWGDNGYGQLGLGNETSRSSPTQIGGIDGWSKIRANYNSCAAIKTNGTLWTWGRNASGQLGLGNTTHYSSPKQVGALTNWSNAGTGALGTRCLITKTDGTLWAWGDNFQGKLGLGDTFARSEPSQVGALTNWLTVATGYTHSIGLG